MPFEGTYTRTAKVTYKNGERVRLVNAGGTATMSVAAGKITYVQTYPEGKRTAHVTQTYTFARARHAPGVQRIQRASRFPENG